ncbi:MAG: hypothetical protein ACE5G2_11205, partial [Candidatus Krumholzibacteriia bacterium]
MGMEEFYGSDKLFTLKDASNASRMREVLWEALRHRFGAESHLVDVDVEVLRRRKQRCVLRYRIRYEQNGAALQQSLIGKVYKADHGEQLHVKVPFTELSQKRQQ